MANKARLDSPSGILIKALDATSNGHTFYCNNRGCSAKLYLCKEGTNSPYFSSYKKADHVYDFCIDEKITFHPDKINESKFDLVASIRRICYKADNDIHNKRGTTGGGSVGKSQEIGLNTAKGIYGMCEYIGPGNSYNGIPIDSIYLCQDNRSVYKTALVGFCVVKAMYERKVPGTSIMKFVFAVNNTRKKSSPYLCVNSSFS